MGPDAWKRMIGESAWQHILTRVMDGVVVVESPISTEATLARALTAATECGFIAPQKAPTVDPRGTKVLWPDQQGVKGSLLAMGLLSEWEARGHGFLLLRVRHLLRAVAGPLLPRLQEILAAYEEECELDGVFPTPINWRVFVGGEQEGVLYDLELGQVLKASSPAPDPDAIDSVTVAGPTAK
jgi:hypothetical protein